MEMGSISFTESASSSPPYSSSSSSHQLNFGLKIKPPAAVPAAGSTPSPRRNKTKAGAARVHGGQPPRCQVEGCQVDLSDAKAYYSRHKVCGAHSKSSLVIVGGIQQRFCQQCSRFHLLSEFDQGKRSCRRRLAGHNERRRKPPAGSLSRFSGTRSGGAFLMDFTAYSSRHFEGYGCSPTLTRRGHQASTSTTAHAKLMSHANVVECYNTAEADSNCALSLLSNQQQPPWGSSPGSNNNNNNMMLLQHQHAAPHSGGGGNSSVVNNHHFQGISSIGGSIAPGLGPSQFYPEEVNLGLSQFEPSRAFDFSGHQMNWSL